MTRESDAAPEARPPADPRGHALPRGRAAWEVGVGAVFVLGGLVVLWEARDLPPGTFEPLGSGPAPRAVATLVIILSLWVCVAGWRRPPEAEEALGYAPRPLDAWAVAAMTVPYVLAMQARLLGFAPLTALFLIATIGWLIRFRLRAMPAVALVAVSVGWGAAYVFTRIFVVDLPGL